MGSCIQYSNICNIENITHLHVLFELLVEPTDLLSQLFQVIRFIGNIGIHLKEKKTHVKKKNTLEMGQNLRTSKKHSEMSRYLFYGLLQA